MFKSSLLFIFGGSVILFFFTISTILFNSYVTFSYPFASIVFTWLSRIFFSKLNPSACTIALAFSVFKSMHVVMIKTENKLINIVKSKPMTFPFLKIFLIIPLKEGSFPFRFVINILSSTTIKNGASIRT